MCWDTYGWWADDRPATPAEERVAMDRVRQALVPVAGAGFDVDRLTRAAIAAVREGYTIDPKRRP